MTRENQPRRHHFFPQMILRNFADDHGRVQFWRRNFPEGQVLSVNTKNLFVQSDLYSLVAADGSKDLSLEKLYSQLEGTAADFFRQLFPVVRQRQAIRLSDAAWEFWYEYMYFTMKRAPAFVKHIAERSGHRRNVDKTIDDLRDKQAEVPPGTLHWIDDPVAVDRVVKNSLVTAQSIMPSQEVLEAFGPLGMSIFRVPARKSLIVGDLPIAMARIGGGSELDGLVSFMPVAPDIAVGFSRTAKQAQVLDLSTEEVRAMNTSMARQSWTIAGNSDRLIASLSRSVPYAGVRTAVDVQARMQPKRERTPAEPKRLRIPQCLTYPDPSGASQRRPNHR